MSTHTLQATTRTIKGRKTNALRAERNVPAIVYGVGTDPQSITIDYNSFIKMYKAAGESSVVNLTIDEKEPLKVLIQDYQQDAVSDDVIHVDFRSIDMNKEIDAMVELVLVGESAAVKTLGGTLIQSRNTVTIHCLPSKLLRNIEVDLSRLETFDDAVRISDLKIPEGVTILESEGLTVALVSKPRTAAEIAELDEGVEGDVAEVEVEGEAEEGEEGAGEGEKAKDEKGKKEKSS